MPRNIDAPGWYEAHSPALASIASEAQHTAERAPQWTRPRYFAGYRRDSTRPGFDVFRCSYVPTDRTHGNLYGYVRGPYRLRSEACEAAGMRPCWIVQQYWTRADGWEDVDAWNGTRREALQRMRTYRDNQPGVPVRIRRVYL